MEITPRTAADEAIPRQTVALGFARGLPRVPRVVRQVVDDGVRLFHLRAARRDDDACSRWNRPFDDHAMPLTLGNVTVERLRPEGAVGRVANAVGRGTSHGGAMQVEHATPIRE